MNMATITESLERSLQNCSLNHERRSSKTGGGGGGGEDGLTRRRSSTSDDNNNNNNNLPITGSDTSLELNSHLSLPYHWEQCLDLKTGEIYYINWRNGMKAREDPRTAAQYCGGFYSEEEEEEEDEEEEDDSSYDSEESPSESSSCSTRERGNCNNDNNHRVEKDKVNVLVVAGCKSCLMYFMVPKQVEDCPKCNGQLLHFDRSESSSP
ncbi:hypothetical protein F3Y22_tig00110831pilonHSYRG00731 [Hibiscus syriacus]|uniref:WW domain-containing protein n=1 Tax=Hibiscus syriacus TaxID=106335 RepID=A0A6A2ZLM7_HIBSY|nr:probable serine/threonine-protein kinase ifkA [Hibiscus syriacus]KAE8692768.1 hypothetical protein F3Y22_tig00110831pilonHSYRG00731 [Hibiscus syriacus]